MLSNVYKDDENSNIPVFPFIGYNTISKGKNYHNFICIHIKERPQQTMMKEIVMTFLNLRVDIFPPKLVNIPTHHLNANDDNLMGF